MIDIIARHYPILVSVFCAAILLVLVAALIFRPQFRKDLLSTESEASLLKVVTIKGVPLLTFVGLFVVGTIYPVWVYSEHCKDTPQVQHGIGAGISLIDEYVQSEAPAEIRGYVEPIVDDLKETLGTLEDGTVTIFRKYAGSKPAKENLVKMPPGTTVLATHVPAKVRGLDDMHAWEKEPLSSYFNLNVEAIKRGVTIRRIFILRKEDLVDPIANCILDRRSVDIMRKHQHADIEVFLTWFEDIERKRDIEDFIVFGDDLVQINESAWSKQGHDKIRLSVNNRMISGYKQKWNGWRAAGARLDEALSQFLAPKSDEASYCVEQ